MSSPRASVLGGKATSVGGPVAGSLRPQYPIESVDNALRLLLLLEEHAEIRLTEASTYLGVASSTAHRLLSMLAYRGFMRQNLATKAYEPGPALTSVAFAVMQRVDVRVVARPLIESLSAEFRETVHLARVTGRTVTFLDAVESDRAVRVSSRVGRSLPAHATSSGKAGLSRLPDDAVLALYAEDELQALTDRTVTSPRELLRQLNAVRRRGFATSDQESEDGVASVAAPVAERENAVYVVNVSVPTHRMTSELRSEIVGSLRTTSSQLGLLLGQPSTGRR